MRAPLAEEANTIVIEGVSWAAYVQMDELLDGASVRMKWCDERLELMSPISRYHELIKGNIGRMIDAFCQRRGIPFATIGSTTMRKEKERGGEPDESYVFTRGKQTADLVIEVAVSSGGLDDLNFYRPLEVPEVWVWQRRALTVHAFHDGGYVGVPESRFAPGLDLALVERLAEHPFTSDMLAEFQGALGPS